MSNWVKFEISCCLSIISLKSIQTKNFGICMAFSSEAQCIIKCKTKANILESK